ncbi:hypothetical protein LPTSP4_09140 [Leptospira ryugenii]|uniref:Uncharacterized protein n=1 Tax=Leptospira ryugenii TaxID=1917863 RepID=A0A2P2DXP1_9LEPT|nr:hypothetical protein [Leptospira ryugenii]GBF49401.1 hypothetical protein LPTSP4_09140 [Leptospira ryugenii]
MSATQIKNKFTLLSGYSKAIGANSNSFQRAIILTSKVNIKKRIHGIVLRYKPGLEDVGFNLESKSIKNLIRGYLPLSVIGAPYGQPGFHCFPLLGRKPMIGSGETIEIKLQTQAVGISEKDVSVSLLVEEVVEDDPEYAKKKPYYFLAGNSDSVLPQKNSQTAITLANSFDTDIRINGWILRYKPGLDNVMVDLISSSIQRTGGIIEGSMSLAVAGAIHGSPAYNVFPIPGKKPVLGVTDNLEVQLSTNNVGVDPRDVAIALVVEEI